MYLDKNFNKGKVVPNVHIQNMKVVHEQDGLSLKKDQHSEATVAQRINVQERGKIVDIYV